MNENWTTTSAKDQIKLIEREVKCWGHLRNEKELIDGMAAINILRRYLEFYSKWTEDDQQIVVLKWYIFDFFFRSTDAGNAPTFFCDIFFIRSTQLSFGKLFFWFFDEESELFVLFLCLVDFSVTLLYLIELWEAPLRLLCFTVVLLILLILVASANLLALIYGSSIEIWLEEKAGSSS